MIPLPVYTRDSVRGAGNSTTGLIWYSKVTLRAVDVETIFHLCNRPPKHANDPFALVKQLVYMYVESCHRFGIYRLLPVHCAKSQRQIL